MTYAVEHLVIDRDRWLRGEPFLWTQHNRCATQQAYQQGLRTTYTGQARVIAVNDSPTLDERTREDTIARLFLATGLVRTVSFVGGVRP